MFKKKKNDVTEQNEQTNDTVNPAEEITDELKHVNESRQHQKNNEDDAVQITAEEKLQNDLKEANEKYLRLYAEFDNYKRRTSKERVELLQTAGKDVIVSLLPVLDDFDRALKSMETAQDASAIKTGIELVQQKLKNMLIQKGLKEMNAGGTDFDAEIHEAITNIPAPSDDLKGKVIDEVEKGYYLNDKVIRFAKVVVGS
ncbi:MAG: nucleotide exchange factor GrpE [Mucilaginibacter polytrichastri]|nr:nucleotide exchange factor GrpE [Mucilaginibacter polytrichastri]